MYEIGYTVGVFDLFHAGHISFLRQAKSQCKFLIVGICSDDLVRRLKNRTPIFSESERIEIISCIKFVDHAFVKNSTDKVKDWEKYHFNVVFHGEQEAKYRQHEIESRDKLTPLGVDFIYFVRDYRHSTSSYINQIRRGD